MATRVSSPPRSRAKASASSGAGSPPRSSRQDQVQRARALRLHPERQCSAGREQHAQQRVGQEASPPWRPDGLVVAVAAEAATHRSRPDRSRPGRGLARLAHLVGSAARAIGSGARDLDPALRRDGLGLFLIGSAIVIAAEFWFGLPGAVGHGIHVGVATLIGTLAYAAPLLLVAMAWRTVRGTPSATAPADVSSSAGRPSSSVCSV